MIYFFSVVLFIILSCTNKNDGSIEILEIKNVPNEATLFLSELCSEIEYVPLDTSKSVFIDNARQYKIVDHYLFILEYREVKRLTAYNISNGKQLFEISNIGYGPNEMAHPVAFFPDMERKRIEIFDSMKRKLFFYDFKGNFLQSISLGFFIVEFTKNRNNDYFFYTGRAMNNRKGNKISEMLILTDSAFKIKNTFLPSNPNLEKLNIRSNKNFSWHKDELYFMQSPDGYLYRLNNESVIPVLRLDFKANNIPDDLRENSTGLNLSEWIKIVRDKGYCMGISDHFANDSFELIKFISIKNKSHYYIKYNKSNGSYDYYGENSFRNDIDNGLFGELIHLDNNRLITIIESYQLFDHMNTNPEFENAELLELRHSSKKFDNPILMVYKLR